MMNKNFEEKIIKQVNLNKPGVYEIFVNQGELRKYLELEGDRNSQIMQKVYIPVFGHEILSISFEESRATANLLAEAGVDTIEELENLKPC